MLSCNQDLCYGVKHDGAARTAIRVGKGPEDATEVGSISHAVNNLKELIANDNKPATTSASEKDAAEARQAELRRKAEEAGKVLSMEITAADIMVQKIKTSSGADVSTESRDRVVEEEAAVTRLMEANITLQPIPTSEKKAREIVANSGAGKMRGKDGVSYVLILIDSVLQGEPVTAPHIRLRALDQPTIKVVDRRIREGRP